MKTRFFVLAVLAIFLMSVVSADIIIMQNPSGLYNLGDIISIPVKITSLVEISDTFKTNFICNGAEAEIVKVPISLSAGQETERNDPIPLIKSFIEDLKGTCRIKYNFGSEVKLTNEFTISDLINIDMTSQEKEFAPGQEITIEGHAKKENGKEVNGFVDMEIIQENVSENIFASDTVKNGLLTLKFSLPKDTASGNYLLEINAYEKDSKGEITNNGVSNYNIFVKQVPTNLEIFLENREPEPGQVIRVKTILHDQTGQQMSSTSTLTILNSKDKITEQKEIATDEFLELTIPSSELPVEWTIKATSSGLSSQTNFKIKAVEKIQTEIIDKTLIVTNIGNVAYNKTLLIKIGSQPLNIDVMLDIGESQKYILSAPDGEYIVDVVVDGESSLNQNVLLTGKAIDVQEAGFSLENNTLIWIIIILILAFFGVKLFKKWNRKSFFGYIPSREGKIEGKKETITLKKSSLITKNKAELELSIKGDRQDISLICLKIKNLDRLRESKTSYGEVLQNLVGIAEEQKAYVYGAQENIFFIYAPAKTKTFRNERNALELAQKISGIISSYNKLAKEKINFGVSISYGTIVANSQGDVLKFMAMGTLMNSSKKLASLSGGEVLLSEKIREKLGGEIKTNKKELSGTIAYTIKEIRDDERSREFIRRFMDRMDKGG